MLLCKTLFLNDLTNPSDLWQELSFHVLYVCEDRLDNWKIIKCES